jgi:hypothetical protein
MPTNRTAIVTISLLVAIPVPTIIQRSLTAIEITAQETRIDREMMDMLQKGTAITNETDGTPIAETVTETSIQEVVVIVSQIPSYQLPPLLQLAVLVLWLLLLTAQTPPSKDAIASTKNEIEREKEIGREKEKGNANNATVNKSTSESSARENSETGSATSVNTKGNVIETWRETVKRNERGLTIARHVLVKGLERRKGTDPGILRRLIVAKTDIGAREDIARSEPMVLLRKRKTLELPLTSDNAHPSLIAPNLPTSISVFLNANVLLLLNLQRSTPTKITVVGWNRHKETCRIRMITWTRKETDARMEPKPLAAGPLLLLRRPTSTILRTRVEKTECASLSPHLIGKTLSRSGVS